MWVGVKVCVEVLEQFRIFANIATYMYKGLNIIFCKTSNLDVLDNPAPYNVLVGEELSMYWLFVIRVSQKGGNPCLGGIIVYGS